MAKNTAPHQIEKITRSEMTDAVVQSGYLMEQRLMPLLRRAHYGVEMNPVYLDPATGKTREYDFSAVELDYPFEKQYHHAVWTHLHGECINNPQPVVFFSYIEEMPMANVYDLKCAGIPLHLIWIRETTDALLKCIWDVCDFDHHYCTGRYSTQYCSFAFKRDKKEWMAWHEEQHHSAFDSLVQSVIYEVGSDFALWSPPPDRGHQGIDLHFYYPVVVLRGELFECTQKRGKPVFTSREHIQYRKGVASGMTTDAYQVDVITESFFLKYLSVIAKDRKAIVNGIRRNKEQVLASVERIIALAREQEKKHKTKDFRKILEAEPDDQTP